VPREGAERPTTSSARRIDEIFGSGLGVERTSGTDEGASGDEEHSREWWYRENRPPHHDDRS